MEILIIGGDIIKKVSLIVIFIITVIINSLILFSNNSIYTHDKPKVSETDDQETVETMNSQDDYEENIDLNSIINNMCPEDKENFQSIVSKLSSDELFKIESNNDKLDKKSFSDNINIIKKRLGSTDYQRIENILKKYIKFDDINI